MTGSLSSAQFDRWSSGECGTYACALQQARPDLRLGVAGHKTAEGFEPQHFFAHDDTHAYDSSGKHALPYHGARGQFGHAELEHDPKDWGLPGDEAGPEGPEPGLRAAQEHARSIGLLPRPGRQREREAT